MSRVAVLVAFATLSVVSAWADAPQDEWERKRWILKLAQTLRDGHGITAAENLGELAKKTDAELFDLFTRSPRIR